VGVFFNKAVYAALFCFMEPVLLAGVSKHISDESWEQPGFSDFSICMAQF